jgi:hypothetical protein
MHSDVTELSIISGFLPLDAFSGVSQEVYTIYGQLY